MSKKDEMLRLAVWRLPSFQLPVKVRWQRILLGQQRGLPLMQSANQWNHSCKTAAEPIIVNQSFHSDSGPLTSCLPTVLEGKTTLVLHPERLCSHLDDTASSKQMRSRTG